MKIRTILSFIFFWSLGISSLYLLIQAMMTGGERFHRMLMPGEHCFLLKYSVVLVWANLNIAMILIPVLMYMIFPRGNAELVPDEHMIRKKKVLFEVILSSMAAPAFLLMGIAAYVYGAEPVRLFLLGSIPVGWYVSQIITLLSYRKK